MKDPKNDSTPVLERFGRDKRKRTVVATAERVERRPRLQRDAADSEQPSHDNQPERRASYNPHFTADNRPAFERPRREEGDRPRRNFDGDKPHRTFGDKPRTFGDKPRYACSSPWLETNATAPAAQWVAGTSVKVPPAAGWKVSVRLSAS